MEMTDVNSFEEQTIDSNKRHMKENAFLFPSSKDSHDAPPPPPPSLPLDTKKPPPPALATTPTVLSEHADNHAYMPPPIKRSFDLSLEQQQQEAEAEEGNVDDDNDMDLHKEVHQQVAIALEESAEGLQQLLDALLDCHKIYRKSGQLLVQMLQEEKAEATRLDGIQAELDNGLFGNF